MHDVLMTPVILGLRIKEKTFLSYSIGIYFDDMEVIDAGVKCLEVKAFGGLTTANKNTE